MSKVFWCSCVLLASGGFATGNAAQAADWMFAPSYYSHADSPGYVAGLAPQSRSGYRLPFVGAHPKFAIRGGIRYNNFTLQNGDSIDRTYIRENWFDVNY